MANRKAWNEGRAVGQKAPFSPQQVRLIKDILRAENRLRDLALFSTGIDTMLRAVDLLKLQVSDVIGKGQEIRSEIAIMQQKTGKAHLVSLGDETREILALWIKQNGKQAWDYLFTGLRRSKHNPISTDQYRRLVKQWAKLARVNPDDVSTHSLRRTKASLVFQATNNAEVVRQLLGHSSIASTSAYLNVGKKEALEIARGVRI